ncbi:MAG TPA: hypothetical protein VFA10_14955, partial [Ktedonobacteraceae bacterium]|nr:hypothetical protein [Ktedonobacteraceae bacterium]
MRHSKLNCVNGLLAAEQQIDHQERLLRLAYHVLRSRRSVQLSVVSLCQFVNIDCYLRKVFR